jgi:hypothetical protein
MKEFFNLVVAGHSISIFRRIVGFDPTRTLTTGWGSPSTLIPKIKLRKESGRVSRGRKDEKQLPNQPLSAAFFTGTCRSYLHSAWSITPARFWTLRHGRAYFSGPIDLCGSRQAPPLPQTRLPLSTELLQRKLGAEICLEHSQHVGSN